jgi:hypothetical protein
VVADPKGLSLFDCEGRETGKVKGWLAKRQLLLDCGVKQCKVKFGTEEFVATRQDDGRYADLGTHYFEFSPLTGEVQGVSDSPYYYFIGKCTKQTGGRR